MPRHRVKARHPVDQLLSDSGGSRDEISAPKEMGISGRSGYSFAGMVRKRAPANDLDEGLLTGDGQEPDLEVVDVEPQPLPVGMTEEQIEEVTRLLRAGRRLPPNLFPHLFENESLELGEDIDTTALKEISNEDSSYPKRASRKIANKFDFRSPVNLVLGTHEPERSFLQRMFDTEAAEKVDGWVKAPDTGFYEISYSWRKGDHTKQGRFNPDLFIKLKSGKDVLVVELKDDTDDSDENRAKLRFATELPLRYASVRESSTSPKMPARSGWRS